MKKILVVGGAGYIGSITVHQLKKNGFEPIIFDNLENGHEDAIKGFSLYRGDLRNYDNIDKAIEYIKPDSIIHFAGYLSVGESVENPLKYFHNNVLGSINLLKSIKKYNINKIIFSSTCATYGQPEILPVNEQEKMHPESPYGESKLMVEKIIQSLSGSINSISLRYFNVAGALPNGSIGEDKQPYATIIPLAIKSIIDKTRFTLNGKNYGTHDGTCIRDYIHVVDLADAHIAALKKLETYKGFDVFNVGVGKGYSNLEIIKMIETVSAKKVNVIEGPNRPGDPVEIFSDNSKIKSKLNWMPRYNLKNIIESAWAWHSNNPKGYNDKN